jgi:large subunit ribosomal protein L6
MITKLLKKNIIKIPKNISVYFCENNILILAGPLGVKSIKLKTQIKFYSKKNYILITQLSIVDQQNISKIEKKKLKILSNTYISILKQIIQEISKKSKQKLNLVGVGYKAILLTSFTFTILQLKLGYSHLIFIKIPKDLIIICPKPTKIFLYGNLQQKINKLSFLIKSYKIPEPYKGKGIFFVNEEINLKKGKKI